MTNPSAPAGPIIPVLSYEDVEAAADWLVSALGFNEQVLVPGHRAQLSFGDGSLIVADAGGDRETPRHDAVTQSVMLRVEDLTAVCEQAERAGARMVEPPRDFDYGERQCSFIDPGGHRWTLTQTLREVDPAEWGGVVVGP